MLKTLSNEYKLKFNYRFYHPMVSLVKMEEVYKTSRLTCAFHELL